MDFDSMSLEELKDYAKELNLKVGNIGKEKLIEKIKLAQTAKDIAENDVDKDIENIPAPVVTKQKTEDLLSSITSAIDDLDDSVDNYVEDGVEDLALDTVIPVKSITYGGLTYQSRTNNAIFRWNQIGAIEYMTVGELNEMNNYKKEFLYKPLVILMDEKAIKKFRLTPVYENVAKINNLKQVFNSDMKTIEKTIDDALAVNMRDILISKVRQMIKNRTLVDVNIIRKLEEKLQFDIQDDLD